MDPVIEEIRRRADIVEVVEEYVPLTPSGAGRWKACCPFHNEKTPSFYVSRDKGFFKCFGCGASGDLFKFVGLSENLPFGEVKRKLAERYGVPLRERSELTPEQQAVYAERDRLLRVTSAAAAWFREQFAGNAGLAARDYARSRGLKRETLEAFGVGYAPDSWDACTQFLTRKFGFSAEDGALAGLLVEKEDDRGKRHYDRYRHRLMFPIWDERGAVIAFGGRALESGRTGTPEAKYINSPEGPLFKKARTLYAWHLARPEVSRQGTLLVTEGYMDAIALHAAGFANTVATLGTSLTQEHARLLRRVQPKAVFLCFDGDSAGMKAALRAGPMFDSLGLAVRVVRLPQQHDPDTFIREFGRAGFEEVLAKAPALAQYRIEHALAGADFSTVASRTEALAQAARVIAEIANESERGEYTARLAHQVALAQGAMDRLALVEASLHRQVRAAATELRQEERNQQRREQERRAVEARLREVGERGGGEVISLPRRDSQAESEAPKYLEARPGHEAGGEPVIEEARGEVLEFKPRRWDGDGPSGGGPSGESREKRRGPGEWKDWKEWKAKKDESPHNRGGSGGTDALAARLLAGVASGDELGAVKAEKALLHVLLNAPSQRAALLEQIAPALWTREVHFEIASRLRELGTDEPVDPPRLLEELSEEAASLAGELLLGEAPAATPEVVEDYIRRVEAHHARRREHEALQLILGKIERGESISPEERAHFAQSARQTKRAVPPES